MGTNNRNFYKYWGKADKEGNYHLLVYHCLDVAASGKAWLESNPSYTKYICRKLNLEIEQFINWFCFALAIHDLGKFAPSFQHLIPDLQSKLNLLIKKEYTNRHDYLGWWVWDYSIRNIVSEFINNSGTLPKYQENLNSFFKLWADPIIKTTTGHHGRPVDKKNNPYCEYDFSPESIKDIKQWVLWCCAFFEIDKNLPKSLFDLSNEQMAEFKRELKILTWGFSGIAVIADWIGSQKDVFTYQQSTINLRNYWEKVQPIANLAVKSSGLIESPHRNVCSANVLFPKFNELTPLQSFCNNVELNPYPQCWILEDVTGAGKTEASMILAGRLMSLRVANGLFIGLPTMATSNAMYDRMGDLYRSFYPDTESPSLVLAHGARNISDKFKSTIQDIRTTKKPAASDDSSAQCASWLADSSKKSLLADIGVGTIDQALLSVLPIKHQSLRVIGLSHKILIVDEVHAYDDYMLNLLKQTIILHGASGGSVILLSATLPNKTRKDLLTTFYTARTGDNQMVESESNAYPLVTGFGIDGNNHFAVEQPIETRSSVKRKVSVKLIDSTDAVLKTISKALGEDKCICWIRNTVGDAIEGKELVDQLTQSSPDKSHLFHSRFMMGDRQEIEQKMLSLFGKNSTGKDRAGRILIATQVVEQSLDLDFDVMITDLAPIDLIIQRAGRLHRHARDLNGNISYGTDERPTPTLYVFSPPTTKEPNSDWYRQTFEGASYVYENHANLWRTQQLLQKYEMIQMPDMARDYIEGVYGDNAIDAPESLSISENKSEGNASKQRSTADLYELDIREGYSLKSNRFWNDAFNPPTRLGDEVVPVFLSQIVNGKIEPLFKSKYGWDMSCLKVRQNFITSQNCDSNFKELVAKLKKENKRFDENDLVLVMSKEGDIWQAQAYAPNDKSIIIRYSIKLGLSKENQ